MNRDCPLRQNGVIPAEAGIQYEKNTPRSGQNHDVDPLAREAFNPLDSGFRRNDGLMDYLG
jgi:hypothetical protein